MSCPAKKDHELVIRFTTCLELIILKSEVHKHHRCKPVHAILRRISDCRD
ncbi:hypothetical protein HanIR_Chr13g0651151 [Helianthus annuus]|nr:hypothetical protein HanIR_Chr13g0651151 [Helianthus annuus]